MSTELEQQLPRFAEALDREAPAISVDEILSRGTVVVDLDGLEQSLRDQVLGVAAGFWGDAMPGHGGNGERDASIELVPTVAARPPARRRVALKVALGVAAAAVLVVALGAIVRTGDELDLGDVPPSRVPIPPSTIPVDPLVGGWLSTDTDGSSQTMEIARSGSDDYDVVIRDEAATAACAGGASTLTGAGRLTTETSLVFAEPELTCDDGTIPPIGAPPQAELANFTLDLDTATGELVDSFGVVWQREGSNVDLVGAASPTTTITASGIEPAASASATSGGMWPQSTLDEVRAAQERADTGDPAYTWQVDPQLFEDDSWAAKEPGQIELVDRFLREVLGWEAYLLNPWEGMVRAGVYDVNYDQRYLRCAPGRTNPLYPPGPEPEWPELCAPTLDDLRYESVSLDLAQLDRQDPNGIWVVTGWKQTAPFAQADPAVVEAQATERLDAFLAARIAGTGAEGHVQVDPDIDVPLLYATTSGAPYERYEIERVDGPLWPYGRMTFSARLFADGDATVVEQQISWDRTRSGGLWLDANATTENGQPVVLPYTSSDGEVTVSAPTTWETWSGGGTNHPAAPGVWTWEFYRDESGDEDRIEFTDPVAYDAWCATNGGSPLLSAPADAAGIAQQVIADPNFDTTAPVAARVGGVEAVSIDVTLAPGGKACGIGMVEISRWIHTIGWDPGLRLRLYLVDLPDGMSVETLAITVVAPEERFDDVIEETAPIIDSIEFHPG